MLNLSLMKADKTTAKDYELMELGKSLQRFYELGYVNKKEALKFSFWNIYGRNGGSGNSFMVTGELYGTTFNWACH